MQLLFFFFLAVLFMHPSEYIEASGTHPRDWNMSAGVGETADRGITWPDMYGMPVLLLMTITLLNDGSLITIGYDNVIGSPQPTQWSLSRLFLVAFVLAAVACVSSLLLLHWALDSWREESLLRKTCSSAVFVRCACSYRSMPDR